MDLCLSIAKFKYTISAAKENISFAICVSTNSA